MFACCRYLAVLTLITACALFTKAREENLNNVQVGQTPAQLMDAIGDPSDQDVDGDSQTWYYEILSRDERRTDPYTAVFEKGVLTRWYFDTTRVGKAGGDKNKGKKTTSP